MTGTDRQSSFGVRVTVYNETDGSKTDLLFPQVPVRIGRNKLNDLVLNHRYVSQWHAVLGLNQARQISIVQVGSSNRVMVGQRQLQPNEEIPVTDEPVRIVPFVLYIQMMQLPDQAEPVHNYSSVISAAGSATGDTALQQVALQLLDRLAERFYGRRIDDPTELAHFGARLEQVLVVFLRCFVALQRGQQEFREAMDIKVLGPSNPLSVTSRSQLAAMLFAGQETEAIEALEHSFKDIMVHQVALLNGLMAGVRTLLGKLSPKTVIKEAAREAGRRAAGSKQLWETFVRIHRDLAEEDNETFETIFGPQFSKAYTMLVGDQDTSQ